MEQISITSTEIQQLSDLLNFELVCTNYTRPRSLLKERIVQLHTDIYNLLNEAVERTLHDGQGFDVI